MYGREEEERGKFIMKPYLIVNLHMRMRRYLQEILLFHCKTDYKLPPRTIMNKLLVLVQRVLEKLKLSVNLDKREMLTTTKTKVFFY